MSDPEPTPAERAIRAAQTLSNRVSRLKFAEPVAYVYNPLKYAWAAHQQYLQRIPPRGVRVLLLGMNPGPWGMVQTGVPFGQVAAVRDWLKIDAEVSPPQREHPKRPVTGLACTRSEVSGERLWGLFRERYPSPGKFFAQHFVANYCPLAFMEESGRNRTPDKLPADERDALAKACDTHLSELIDALRPKWLVGVGAYAKKCLERVAGQGEATITSILHPSPASPAANRGWAPAATKQLVEAGIWRK